MQGSIAESKFVKGQPPCYIVIRGKWNRVSEREGLSWRPPLGNSCLVTSSDPPQLWYPRGSTGGWVEMTTSRLNTSLVLNDSLQLLGAVTPCSLASSGVTLSTGGLLGYGYNPRGVPVDHGCVFPRPLTHVLWTQLAEDYPLRT